MLSSGRARYWSQNQMISHRDDQAARMVGQSAAHGIMRFNATQNPATAVKIDQRGERPLLSTSGRIDTNGQRACGTANETILNGGNSFRFSCLCQSRLL